MKNVPRIFIDSELREGAAAPLTQEQLHYLTRVMRTDRFLAFNGGVEYEAMVENGRAKILAKTCHADPSGDWTFCFAPIKRMEDLLAGIVQMGVGRLLPVITERTVAQHINWGRMKKIIIENCEQSGRNSVPELLPPISFASLDKKGLAFGDERKLTINNEQLTVNDKSLTHNRNCSLFTVNCQLFVGPEGGFSDAEFAALEKGGAIGVNLGKTILRSEVAAIALCAKLIGG